MKIIFIGTGASGKTTLAKQMRIVYLNGFSTEKERIYFKEFVHHNILDTFKNLIKSADELNLAIDEEFNVIFLFFFFFLMMLKFFFNNFKKKGNSRGNEKYDTSIRIIDR